MFQANSIRRVSWFLFFAVGVSSVQAEINVSGRQSDSKTQVSSPSLTTVQRESIATSPIRQTTSSIRQVTTPLSTDIRRTTETVQVTANFTGLSNITGPAAETPLSNSISFSFSPASVTLTQGESTTINVSIQRSTAWLNGTQPKQIFVTIKDRPDGVIIQQSKTMIGGSTTSFTVEITAGPNSVAGIYSPALYALIKEPNGQQAYTHYHSFQVNIEDAAAADPIDNFATLQFSNLQDTSPMYTNGFANVQQSFAVYDSNQNGIIDSEAGYDNTPFPGFPVAGGGANVGRAYAMPYEERANLVVAAQYGPFEWVAVHFRIRDDGNVVPIQALIGDFTTGEIMIQDLAGWTYDVSGSLPANGQNGHFSGTISFDPFYYDGVANYILGNHVEFGFDVALESDF